jgi:hypothetical protein
VAEWGSGGPSRCLNALCPQQLGQVVKDMKMDLEGILGFIESCGMYLDDHYQHIRHLVSQYD